MVMKFNLHPVVLFSGNHGEGFLTDHNRGALSVSYEEIGNTERTASGTMRGYVVARKRSWSLDWSMVPASSNITVDGYWSINELMDFYHNTLGEFNVKFYRGSKAVSINDPQEVVACRFSDISYEVIKRGVRLPNGQFTDYCDFSCSWVEV